MSRSLTSFSQKRSGKKKPRLGLFGGKKRWSDFVGEEKKVCEFVTQAWLFSPASISASS